MYIFSDFPLKDKKLTELEEYEKEYLKKLEGKEKTKPAKQEKPAKRKTMKAGKKKSTKKSDTNAKIKKPRKRKNVKSSEFDGDSGIVLIADDLAVDKEKELEERRAYLEEARSQESLD